jgi:hypothetical protein
LPAPGIDSSPLSFQRRVARDRLDSDAVEIPGGHLVALSRPIDLVEQLITYAE